MNKKFIFSLILTFIFSLTLAIAAGPSFGVPHQFYGDAVYNNVAADGLLIEAYIDGVRAGNTTALNGKYGYSPIFLIKDISGLYSGKTIEFYLNGVKTGQTSIFENGASTRLDLSATGATAPTPPPSTGGGSSGGGSSSRGGSNGGSSGNSTTTQTATSPTTGGQTTTPQNNKGNETNTGMPTSTKNQQKGIFSGITGAVTGALGTAGLIGALIFIIAIIVLAIFIPIIRKKKLGKSENLYHT